jgi:hypothetical protein
MYASDKIPIVNRYTRLAIVLIEYTMKVIGVWDGRRILIFLKSDDKRNSICIGYLFFVSRRVASFSDGRL